MNINIISAVCKKNGIGYRNTLPWHFSKDLKYFAYLTKHKPQQGEKNAIIMGRNTWNSLSKPLPDRSNYIISNTLKGKHFYTSIDECISHCREKQYTNVWIIGGQQIYERAILRNDITQLYITKINKEYKCDTFFPDIPNKFQVIQREIEKEKNVTLFFYRYKNVFYHSDDHER